MKTEQYSEGTAPLHQLLERINYGSKNTLGYSPDAIKDRMDKRNKFFQGWFGRTVTKCHDEALMLAANDGAVITDLTTINFDPLGRDENRTVVDVFYLRDDDVMTCVGYHVQHADFGKDTESEIDRMIEWLEDNSFQKNVLDFSNGINGTLLHVRGNVHISSMGDITWVDGVHVARVESSALCKRVDDNTYVCVTRRFTDRLPNLPDTTIHSVELTMIGWWDKTGKYWLEELCLDKDGASVGDPVLLQTILNNDSRRILDTLVPRRNPEWIYYTTFNLTYWRLDDEESMWRLSGAAAYFARPKEEPKKRDDSEPRIKIPKDFDPGVFDPKDPDIIVINPTLLK